MFGSGNDTGIYYLPFFRCIIGTFKKAIKFCKQFLNEICLGKLVSEKPDGLGIRDTISQSQVEKTHKRQPVKNLKFDGIIRKIVKGLDDENFEHQNYIIVFWVRTVFCLFLSDLLKCRSKLFPIDKPVKLKKRILVFIDLAKSIMDVKQPCLQNYVLFSGINSLKQCLTIG